MSSDTTPTPQPPPPPPGPAPGQAKISGTVVAIDQKEAVLKLEVKKVLGYGASTPPVAVSDTLRVHYTGNDQNEISIGKIVTAVISYRYQLDDSGSSSPLWSLVSFEAEPN